MYNKNLLKSYIAKNIIINVNKKRDFKLNWTLTRFNKGK